MWVGSAVCLAVCLSWDLSTALGNITPLTTIPASSHWEQLSIHVFEERVWLLSLEFLGVLGTLIFDNIS